MARPVPVSRHLVANVVGRGWALLSNLLLVPAYVHLLGMDSYGVIALYIATAGVIALLDLGFSPALARELHDQRRSADEKVKVLFTYEVVFAGIVGCIALFLALLPADAYSFLLAGKDLNRPDYVYAIKLVFVAAVLQLPFYFYIAGLLGVEEQVTGNVVLVAAGVVRGVVVIVPLWFYRTPTAYLLWQAVFTVVFALVARHWLYRALVPDSTKGHRAFELRLVTDNLSFTGGMFLVSAAAAINTQADKFLMGKHVGLAALGEYSLVSSFAQLLIFIVSPVTIALMPRFVRAASTDDTGGVTSLFLISYRLVAALVCSALGTMVFFGPYLVELWAVGKLDANAVAAYAAPLLAGYGLLALGVVPHSVAVANKNLKGSMLIALTPVLTLPAYWYSIDQLGALGAAITWLALQAVVVPTYTYWVNQRFIRLPRMWRTLLGPAVLLPLLASCAVNALAYCLVSASNAVATNLLIILVAAVIGVCSCVFVALRGESVGRLLRAATAGDLS